MKTPKFETAVGALIALLATRSFVFCDVYTFLLAGGGTPLRYTTGDTDIAYNGNTWTHSGPKFDQTGTRATGHWKIGLDTDTWSCLIAPRPVDLISGAPYPDQIGGQPWLAACLAGALDGAVVQVDRCFLPAWPSMPRAAAITPTGVVNLFTGRIATVDVGRSAAVIQLNSHLELLDQQMPINVYQAGCRHTLYDAGCGLNAATYASPGSILAGSSPSSLLSALGAPGGSGTFTLGRLTFTTGANATFSRTIRSWSPPSGSISGVITLLSPLPFPVAAGDQFTAWPGCDKQLGTCGAFGNLPNFGGMPWIPPPETAT